MHEKYVNNKTRAIIKKLPTGERPPTDWFTSQGWIKTLADMVGWCHYFTDGTYYLVLRDEEVSLYFGDKAIGELDIEELVEAIA